MKYVLDSSVALKAVLPEVDSWKAIRLLDEYRRQLHDLIAPDVFIPEVANGLVSAERQGRVKPGESGLLVNDLLLNQPAIIPCNVVLVRGMEIALLNKQAVYDCLYVALAEQEKCEFLTADDAMAKKLRAFFPFIVSLSALP
jgi:predicted nucleic acid-binding protein